MTVDESIKQQDSYVNLPQWDKAGFTGETINVWNTEGGSDHSQIVQKRVMSGATKCNIFTASLSMLSDNEKVEYAFCTYQGTKYEVEEFIKKFNIKIVTRSVSGRKTTGNSESIFFNNLKDKYKLVFFNSAGNDGSEGAGGSFPSDVAYYIAACTIGRNGKPVRARYSAIDDVVDFCTFVGIWSGTSFAAPYLAGISTRLKKRYGLDMSHEEIGEYFRMISQDMESSGEDDYTGYGIPILPDVSKKYITLKIGDKNYYCDGKEYIMDTSPIIIEVKGKGGVTFVPIRAICEILGKKVLWNEKTKTVTIYDDINTVVLAIGSTEIKINNKSSILELPPFVDDMHRTQVPLRAIGEAFNCKIGWVQKYKKVLILES